MTAKDWYSPAEIKFTRSQALWLIRNLSSLRSGNPWPTEPSSYIDTEKIRKKGGRKAPFETPIEYAAEITDRMEKCGEDGLILLAIECWGESEESLANYLNRPLWSIEKRYKRALTYIASGPARRWHDTKKQKGESYKDFRGIIKK